MPFTAASPADYKMEDFQRFVGEDLEFLASPEPVRLRLDSITPKGGASFLTREGFRLNFSSEKTILLVAGTYQMRVSPTEILIFYLEPVLSVGTRRRYQSVFF